MGRVIVIGIGNLDRGDDGVGRIVARRLRDRVPRGVAVVEKGGGAAELMAAWEGCTSAIIVDAVQSGGKPGVLHRIEAHSRALPSRLFAASTHGFGLAEAVELARALGSLPPRVVVYGVEAASLDPGGEMSLPVRRSVDEVVWRVLGELGDPKGGADDA